MKTLPHGWRRIKVGSLFEVQLGKMLSPAARQGDVQLPYLTNANVQWGKFRLDELNAMSFTDREQVKFGLKSGDLLVCEGGEVGRSAIWKSQISLCFFQKTLHRLRPKSASTIASDYMLAYLRYVSGTKLLSDLTSQSSIAHLTREKLLQLDVVFPPLSEQRRIADILSTWDEALEKLDILIIAKERQKQGLAQQLLSGKLRLKGFKHKWHAIRMSDALQRVFRPIEVLRSTSLDLVSIRRRMGGLFRRPGILASEYKTQDLHQIRAGDFLISKRQVVHGAWSIVEPEFDGALVSKEYAILSNLAPQRLNMRFFSWLAQTPRMVRLARVSSIGVHIEKLIFDADVFLREQIRVPSDIEEQSTIAEILDAAAAELRLLNQKRDAIDQQKRGLMHLLLTGKVRVA